MTFSKDDLRRSAAAASIAVLRYASSNNGLRQIETDTWVRFDDSFVRRTWDRLVYRPDVMSKVRFLPEVCAFFAALRSDTVLGPMLNRYVGPRTGMGVVLNESQLLSLLLSTDEDPSAPRATLDFNETHFQDKFDALLRFRQDASVPYIQLRPLIGYHGTEPITIEPGLTIEAMSDSEIIEGLTWGVLPTHLNQFRRFDPKPGLNYAIKRRYQLSRVTLPQYPIEVSAAEHAEYNSDGDDLAQSLTILVKGRIVVGPTFLSSPLGWPYSVHSILQPTSIADEPRGDRDMHVPKGVEGAAQSIWTALRTGSKAYRLAARRFYNAQLRGFVEDNFLDDMIAAEALFLEPRAKMKSKTLASNAANYLDESRQSEWKAIFDLFRNAYRVRSATVHGEEPNASDMRVDEATVSFIDFKNAVEHRLRAAFQRMVERNETACGVDWASMTLGSEP